VTSLVPAPARLVAVVPECSDTSTFVVRPDVPLPGLAAAVPGQFVMVSVFGHGEAAFTLSALPGAGAEAGTAVVTVRRVGALTSALFRLGPGARVGLRGPFGRGFPPSDGEPVVYVAGGCGLSPLRAAIARDLERDGCRVAVLYGVRDKGARIHRADLARWARVPGVTVLECVERASHEWSGRVGAVLDVVGEAVAAVGARRAALCGPPAMLPVVAHRLARLGLDPGHVHVALERYMKCGSGLCGHCYVNERFICTDGPVFSLAELQRLPDAFGPETSVADERL